MTKVLIVNNAEQGVSEFIQPIEKTVKETNVNVQFIEYKECLTTNLNEFDGIILSGSPQGDDIVEHHLPYFKWLIDYNKPVLGICAGHHITGYIYGAELLRSKEPESGDVEIIIVKKDPIFQGFQSSFTVKQMHNDSITLPCDFELLATSATCENQMMKHKNKPLHTCQFHPEFYNSLLIKNFIAIRMQS